MMQPVFVVTIGEKGCDRGLDQAETAMQGQQIPL
jgi:hypothetical protein